MPEPTNAADEHSGYAQEIRNWMESVTNVINGNDHGDEQSVLETVMIVLFFVTADLLMIAVMFGIIMSIVVMAKAVL